MEGDKGSLGNLFKHTEKGDEQKMKIVNKKRFISVISVIALIVITLFSNCYSAKKVETENYTVSAGDTLWSISCKYKKSGQDVREYVYELRELNNLDDCIIYLGQVIQIIK